MTDQDIPGLMDRLFKGTITPAEKELLADWIQHSGKNQDLESLMERSWKDFEPGQTIPSEKAGQLLESIMEKAKAAPPVELPQAVPVRRIKWYRLAAAVMTAAILSGAGFYFMTKHKTDLKPLAVAKTDVAAPAVSNAVLTLANGKTIDLDSVENGSLCMQGNTAVVKLGDGAIAYRANRTGENMEYNTLTVPRGSRIAHIMLADGTAVWLNAGSSLKYPVAFAGKERRVSVTGETYFEVAHNVNTPFIVSKGDQTIQVLGTHFNVNAYEDETDMKVTLLEGAVAVASPSGRVVLEPGQLASIHRDERIDVADNVNVEAAIAWKNGVFQFFGADIKSVMRELSRWYGLELEFKDEIHEKFHVEISRNTNVSDVFRILETTGAVHFRVEGNKVTIMR